MKGVYQKAGGETLSRRLELLARLQREPFSVKLAHAHRVIAAALEHGRPCVLYSGGADSAALLELVREQAPATLVMHNDTTLGDPARLAYVRATAGDNYRETTAPDPFTMWQETGYWPIFGKRTFTAWKRRCPGLRCSPIQCCYRLKEAPANRVLRSEHVGVAFWGNRADESMRRKFGYVDNGAIVALAKNPWVQAYPIAHWTRVDVEQYLEARGKRQAITTSLEAGCLVCGTDITRWPNNLSRLYQQDPERWRAFMLAGAAAQILKAKSIDADPAKTVAERPTLLLRV